MDSAWPQSPLSNFKAAPLAEQHILDRNANILQLDFAMTMRRIVIAKHRKHSQNLNPRRVERQEDHALLSMARGIRIGLTPENADRASRISYARTPTFAAVDHIMVAVTTDGVSDFGGVRGCDLWPGLLKPQQPIPHPQ